MSDSKIQQFREKVEALARESGLNYKELSEILSFLSYRYAFFWSGALGGVEIGPKDEMVSS